MNNHTTHSWFVFVALALALGVFLSGTSMALSYVIEDTGDAISTNSFVLTPSKTELSVYPGDVVVHNVVVTNQTDSNMTFSVGVEDFVGSDKRDNPIVLLGETNGPYSLKDFIDPELDSFTLFPGQRITLPVSISVPSDASHGGHYGAVIISSATKDGGTDDVQNTMRLISRLGSLFLVTVGDERHESGALEDFQISGSTSAMYDAGPFEFEIRFRNNGNVHLVPNGVIEITDMFGSVVDSVSVEPYFVLPNATRFRSISWDDRFLFGRYTATLMLHRGYGDYVDERSVSLWVFPWKQATAAALALVIFFIAVRFFWARFEIRKKDTGL